jgi:hypothetical protein
VLREKSSVPSPGWGSFEAGRPGDFDARATRLVGKDPALDRRYAMKKNFLLALFLATPSLSLAQAAPHPAAPGGAEAFDPSTVVTVSGTALGRSRFDLGDGRPGVDVLLRTTRGDILVQLGADFWVEKQALNFRFGDVITVRGFMIAIGDKPTIIAQSVTWGTSMLELRTAEGVPLWPAVVAPAPPRTWQGESDSRLFDPSTVVTVWGTVLARSRIVGATGAAAGVDVRLGTPGGEIRVHLGPGFWVDKQALNFAIGDVVAVKGSMITIEGKPTIIAESVTWGTSMLELRDARGVPIWRG